MLTQYNGEKIRRAGNIIHFDPLSSTFAKYGLNKYKNFLKEGTIDLADKDAMDRYATVIMNSLSEDYESAALFFDFGKGIKRIYEMYLEYYEQDGDTYEEPYMSRYDIDDPFDKVFAQFDSDNNYEIYGLLLYRNNGFWKVVSD